MQQIKTEPTGHIFAIVDHSFQFDTASFGWFLFSRSGDVLAECHGPSPGPPSRPRADAWGVLSLLRFLFHLPRALATSLEIPPLTVLNRNPRIIRVLRDRPRYPTVYCNDTLTPNWDVLEQSHVATLDLPSTITWQTLMDFKDKYDPAAYPRSFALAQKIVDSKACTKEFLTNTYAYLWLINTAGLPRMVGYRRIPLHRKVQALTLLNY